MSQQIRSGNKQGIAAKAPARRPLAHWIAAALAVGAMQAAHAGTPPVLSSAWLAQRQNLPANAAGAPSSGVNIPGLGAQTSGQLLQQKVVQQSIANLNNAAQAVAAQMAAQQQAAQMAQQLAGSPVPNGLTPGGLQVAAKAGMDPSLWQNANRPTQSTANGQTTVDIKQTAQKAILTWDSFNVGRQTTVYFDQSAGNQSNGSNNWIALNRIQDPSGVPSQIFGQIKAEGTVYLLNRNGILFGAGSQVNTRSFLASSLDLFSSDVSKSNQFFLQNGIGQSTDTNDILGQGPGAQLSGFLVDGTGTGGSTTGAVTIEQGASITAGAQGFALVAAPSVSNAGAVVADAGQVLLAASDSVRYVPPVTGGDGRFSIDARNGSLSSQGTVLNTGLVQARQGTVQWLGADLEQDGVVVVSTSLTQPGTIDFDTFRLARGANGGVISGGGAIRLGGNSVTTDLPEKDGATTSSSAAADAAFKPGSVSMTGNTVVLDQGALLEAPGASVSLTANLGSAGQGPGRIYIDDGATIDVSGIADVELPMSALLVSISRIGGNELADSPLLRNSFLYGQHDIVVDSSQSGVRADGLDWVGSPILNVSGYVENVPRDIEQLLTKGGSITLAGDEVIARSGSHLLLNGGYLAYQPGWVSTPNLLGADGRIYNIDNADPDISYVGFAGQYTQNHSRWGVSETWSSALLAGMPHYDDGFIVGGDAGSLVIEPSGASMAPVLDGDIEAHAYTGRNQARQGEAPQSGSLSIVNIALPSLANEISLSNNPINFLIGDQQDPLQNWRPGFSADTPLADDGGAFGDPDDPFYWRTISAAMLDNAGFSSIVLESGGTIKVEDGATLSVVPGGSINLTATRVDVEGTLQAASGKLALNAYGGLANFDLSNKVIPPLTPSAIVVGSNGNLDASGLFVNDSGLPADRIVGDQFIDGGSITLSAWKSGTLGSPDDTGNIDLQAGSVLDVSSGAYVGSDGQLALQSDVPLGKGGDISIGTHEDGALTTWTGNGGRAPANLSGGQIHLDGTLLGYGFAGGGTLSLHAAQIQIGGTPTPSPDASLLYLPADFFAGQGFSRYVLTADTDATIADGTTVLVRPTYLLPDYQNLQAAPTGTRFYSADGQQVDSRLASLGSIDPYHRWLLGDQAGFSLSAGNYLAWNSSGALPPSYEGVSGTLTLGTGAAVLVDAGATVNLSSAGQLTVLGTVRAPGGDISLNNLSNDSVAQARSIWLGRDSVLDASGTVLVDPLAASVVSRDGELFQPATGTVLDGGSVSLSTNGELLAQAGALIDVSGAQGTFDLPTAATYRGLPATLYTSTPVWSDAGNILLTAGAGMRFDASLRAEAGAPEADGGTLTIAGLAPLGVAASGVAPKALVIQASGDLLSDDLIPGDLPDSGTGTAGMLYFAADRLAGSGITTLAIGPTPGDSASETNDRVIPLLFSGDVNLSLGRAFIADAAAYAAVPAGQTAVPANGTITGAGKVSIDAPYIYLAGTQEGNIGASATPVPRAGDGALILKADFLDMGGYVLLQGFGQASFASRGDLRFYLPAEDAFQNGQPQTGWLYSTGNLDFTASRIYPGSDYSFLIDAGSQPGGDGGTTTVSFHNSGVQDTSTPLSAGGTLVVAADHIEQDSTLWVPSGSIVLGINNAKDTLSALGLAAAFPLTATQSVHLAPGSVTSVSLDGAVLPFGSTVDGTDWRYDGDPSASASVTDLAAPPSKQITIAGQNVSLDDGAKVDVSGGGDLQAQEWVPGTGGARDVLAQSQANADGSASPQYPDGRAIYAIVPGYRAPVGAYDPALAKGAGDGPAVGQAVYLSGMPGLPAGVYTLLPAKYATLPGAYRVVQNTSAVDSVVGRNATLPDGTLAVTGYFADALTGARQARSTTFLVQSGPVWQQYSQYNLTSANSYFSAQAEHAGTAQPPLPEDAGHLKLEAISSLSLDTTLAAAAADGGRGALVDIAGQAIQIVAPGTDALDGYLHIDADGLTKLGAASLLIGGTRDDGDDGDVLDVTADSVVLANDTTHPLSGPEVILVANGQGNGIALDAGSALLSSGSLTDADNVPLLIGKAAVDGDPAVSGDGVLVRVANGAPSPIVRSDVTGIDGPAGNAGGALDIGAGVLLGGGQSLSLDATGDMHVDPSALFSAQAIDVTANHIAFIGNAPAEGRSGFLVGSGTLAQFSGTDSVTLRSRSTIDFVGDIDAGFGHSLTLDATALGSDGGEVNLSADQLLLTNDLSDQAEFAGGSGRLNIVAGELDFGAGDMTLQGFGSISAQASRGMAGQGSGNFDFGNLDVNLATPVFLADTGASTHLTTTGALNLAALDGAALDREAWGGRLALTGGTMAVSTDLTASGGGLTLEATRGDLVIGDGARLSVAGAAKAFNDTQSYVPGGTLTLTADDGSIHASAGSVLDISGDASGGNAGRLVVQATGIADLQGALLGHAADGYLGGNLHLDSDGAVDLDSLADRLAAGGIDGTLAIRSGAGDLALSAGHALTAHGVNLTADGAGGWVRIDGTVDASGDFGSPINLYGQGGVDIEGTLLSNATQAGHSGGDIALGTVGHGDGHLTAYGYEEVQASGSGTIHIGPNARLDLSGPGGGGSLELRAPLLADGDVNVAIDNPAAIQGAAGVALEAYATWSTADAASDPSRHFDGLVDPAGWYTYGADGKPQLVSGTWTDADGNTVAPPDSDQVTQYLAQYFFTPDDGVANAAHQTFYGYVNGDPTQGAGTLMSFVEAPGFAFESRFAGVANFHARPGIDLVNPSQDVNNGDISVLTNWNLGAGTRDPDGTLHQVYRYGDQAPVLSLRADNDLVIEASITDGFFQDGSVAAAPTPDLATFEEASAAYQNMVNAGTSVDQFPDQFPLPTDFSSSGGNALAISEYYGQYVDYANYLGDGNISEFLGFTPGGFITNSLFGGGLPIPGAPSSPQLPANLNQYPNYLSKYEQYLFTSVELGDPFCTSTCLGFPELDVLAAPPTTLDLINTSAPVDNSPSPQRVVDNPLPLASAGLVGGDSSTYRLVAGANTNSADPLAIQAINVAEGVTGRVTLDGHTDYADPGNGRVVYAPTLIRTGTGDISIVAAGDIEWLDGSAPAAIYAAGAPAAGTAAEGTTSLLRTPSGFAEQIVTDEVNPTGAGDVLLSAGGNIDGIQQVVDTDGSVTGVAGTSIAQYWWQWMQTGNAADGSRSSINFGAFDQGVMSVGGNVDVAAGGDIRELSVSLPTTWYANADRTAITTVGGGDLNVRAGNDILGGSYFVARGSGTISAGGDIGSAFDYAGTTSSGSRTTPVATLLAMQDADLDVQAGGSVNIGGVYDPSWLDSQALDGFLPAGHADGQGYGTDSALSILSAGGDLTYGSLATPMSLFVPGAFVPSAERTGTAGNVLPATVDFSAPSGDISILAAGELYPSPEGNLGLLASGSITFSNAEDRAQAQSRAWGLIDAPLSLMPSPLNVGILTAGNDLDLGSIRTGGYIGIGEFTQLLHQTTALHGSDDDPVRIYALNGDIVDGAGFGAGAGNLLIAPDKPALLQAGRDIVDLAFLGQHSHASDVTLIRAGRDIYDTPLVVNPALTALPDPVVAAAGKGILPVLLLGGPGTLVVEAGRDIGPLSNQVEFNAFGNRGNDDLILPNGASGQAQTGIETVGNAFNPYLPAEGANIQVLYGVGPGIDQADFIARYIDPAGGVAGIPSLTPELVSFMESYQDGKVVDTGFVGDKISVQLTPEQAWEQFQSLPDYVQSLFVEKALFAVLAEVGSDYNDPASPYFQQYARGYAALDTLFPASLGYTANGSGQGGLNGAAQTVDTGDLDIRSSTIQTQQGGNIGILAPGGQALVGSTAAPALITDSTGKVLAGPNTMGILTLEQGDVDIFTDRSVLLAQSRIFTEQGGDMTIWSSNGDINAGQGAKTTTELATASYLCTPDAFCLLNPSGSVSGAGIATLQSIPGAPPGNVYLIAPRGTVDAGDAGIRVSGNIVIAAARVLNADNIQVQGEKIGVPVVQSVNVSALTAASAAASAVSKVADDMARRQQNDARSNMPSIISVQVLGFGGGDTGASLQGEHQGPAYDADSPVQVLGGGHLDGKRKAALTVAEQRQLRQ